MGMAVLCAQVSSACARTGTGIGHETNEKEIADLRKQVEELRKRLPTPDVRVTPEGVANGLKAQEQQFEQRLAQDGKDDTKAARLTESVRKVLGSGTLDGVQCGTTLCRVATTHPTEDAFHKFAEHAYVGDTPIWVGSMWIFRAQPASPNPEAGPVKAVVFLGNEQKAGAPPPAAAR